MDTVVAALVMESSDLVLHLGRQPIGVSVGEYLRCVLKIHHVSAGPRLPRCAYHACERLVAFGVAVREHDEVFCAPRYVRLHFVRDGCIEPAVSIPTGVEKQRCEDGESSDDY